MKKHLLTLILTLLTANACAEWQSIGENAAQTAYVDAANIQHGKHNKMWGLFDLKAPRTLGDMNYLSMKIQREYACHNKKSRIIAKSAHSDNMGAGEIIYRNNTPDKWAVVQPDSAEAALWDIACEAKRQ